MHIVEAMHGLVGTTYIPNIHWFNHTCPSSWAKLLFIFRPVYLLWA